MRWSRSRSTSSMKSTPVAAAIASDRVVHRVALGDPPRRVGIADAPRVVEHQGRLAGPRGRARSSFGPPLNPAKKWGSTKPVVMRTSASTHSRFSHTGTSSTSPHQRRLASSRASWFTTRTRSSTSAPSIASSSSGVLPRWVPVATSTTMSLGSTMPSSSSSTAGIITCRGCGRVPSHIEIATVCPGWTRSRSGGTDGRPPQRARAPRHARRAQPASGAA